MKQRFGRVWKIRRLRGGALLVLSAYCLAAAAVIARADETNLAGDKAELQVLRARLDKLEKKVEEQEATSQQLTGVPSIGGKPGAAMVMLPSGLQGLGMSGYVDASYVYNFEHPDPGTGRINRGRVFDNDAGGFTPHVAELVLEKAITDEMPVGFRTDFFFGDDAEVIHSTGAGTVTDQFDLQQAYVTARAPLGNGIDFKVGKFVTLLGAEVIESPSNWNFSRSFLFGYAIPFTHTGALASYSFGDLGSATVGLVNGWDIVDDNNNAKSMLGNITMTPLKGVSLSFSGITGAERTSDNRNDRTVLDIVASWNPIEPLTLMANYDYGHESSVTHGVAGTAGFDTGNWQGLALYTKYDLTPKWSLAGRAEWFNDMDNTRVALTGPGGSTLINGIQYYGYTLTSAWKLHEHLIARLEYRHDQASERVFFSGGGGFDNAQDTIATELICHF